jgi:hypothetical protein
MGAALELAMIPISRRKQIVGVAVVVACSYAISWAFTPGPGTGPAQSFAPTFSQPAPVVILPQEAAPSRDKKVTTSEPSNSSPKPLQRNRYEPI